MEVFPTGGKSKSACLSLLHVRGGVSTRLFCCVIHTLSSPRPWRCFSPPRHRPEGSTVFSTSVEVFLSGDGRMKDISSLLHVRGGVSGAYVYASDTTPSSPRPWRCFSKRPLRLHMRLVFSTSVEVFPEALRAAWRRGRLLHVRGGVSHPDHYARYRFESSPRPWRCFCCESSQNNCCLVFSTSVEVFLLRPSVSGNKDCLLHVRGGVSAVVTAKILDGKSSPRPWRCFCADDGVQCSTAVFSTSVEVFPRP